MSKDKAPPVLDDQSTEMILQMVAGSALPIAAGTIASMKPLHIVLNEHMGKRSLSTDVLFERIGASRSFGFRVMSGTRRPGRNTIISLAVELSLGYDETQALLKSGRVAQLTPRDERDLILLFGILHRLQLGEINDMLDANQMECLA